MDRLKQFDPEPCGLGHGGAGLRVLDHENARAFQIFGVARVPANLFAVDHEIMRDMNFQIPDLTGARQQFELAIALGLTLAREFVPINDGRDGVKLVPAHRDLDQAQRRIDKPADD